MSWMLVAYLLGRLCEERLCKNNRIPFSYLRSIVFAHLWKRYGAAIEGSSESLEGTLEYLERIGYVEVCSVKNTKVIELNPEELKKFMNRYEKDVQKRGTNLEKEYKSKIDELVNELKQKSIN